MKILIIDDSTINNILLQNILEEHGYTTKSELEGQMAVKRIEEFNPDLIILDIMMPEISGFEVLKKLQQRDNTIPVVALSAYHDKKYEQRALSLGASAYLYKPVDSRVLYKTIEDSIITKA